MKLKIVLVVILLVGLGVGLGAGIFLTKSKDKVVITNLQKSEAAAQEKTRNNGDLISQLANQLQQTKIELEQLRQANPTPAPTADQAAAAPTANGQTAAAPANNSIPGNTTQYTIKSGDSLWSIAKNQLGNSNRVNDILKLNPKMTAKSNLVVGGKLILPAK